MAKKIFPLSENAFKRTETCVQAFETNANADPRASGGHQQLQRSNIVAILLEDLDKGGIADVAVTELTETTEIQRVYLEGHPTGGTFRLSFNAQQTAAIPYDATAAQVQAALEALETIGKGNVSVSLGKTNDWNPFAWLVTFIGPLGGQDVALLGGSNNVTGASVVISDTTLWVDSGRIESVRCVVPVGTPTPLRAGSVVVAIPFVAAGYGVVAAECRDFNPYYL